MTTNAMAVQDQARLEHLVDRVIGALLPAAKKTVVTTNATTVQDRARLEHLVDRMLGALLPAAVEDSRRTLVRLVHQARAARRAGEPRHALDTLADVELASAPRDLACWAYGEWHGAIRQLELPAGAVLYRAATGQAAVLAPDEEPGCLRVVAALGLSWQPGRVLSRRCLRGLAALQPSPARAGGAA